MSKQTRIRRWATTLVGIMALGTLGVGVHAAHAAHTPCDDEGVAGGDLGNDVGPGIVFVGVDAVDDPAICVTSGGVAPESNESVVVDVEDPNPGAPGLSVAIRQRSCTDQAGLTCTTDDLVGQTGLENPGVTPLNDLPGGGTIGTGLTVTSECIWIDGDASCGGGSTVSATAWESDLPATSSSGCLVDAPGAPGCDVQGATVTVFGDGTNPTARVSRSGVPGIADGDTDVAPGETCVGVGTACP